MSALPFSSSRQGAQIGTFNLLMSSSSMPQVPVFVKNGNHGRLYVRVGLCHSIFSVSHIINEYRNEHTPIPDVLWNTRIKFGAFLESIKNLEFDYIASRHYEHVVHLSVENVEGPSVHQSISPPTFERDKVNDQSMQAGCSDRCTFLTKVGRIPRRCVFVERD